MANETIFAKGVMIFPKKENQPDWVIASMVIDVDNIATDNEQYLTSYNNKRQLRVQMLRSKEGNPYMSVDTWKPNTANNTDTRTSEELQEANKAGQ